MAEFKERFDNLSVITESTPGPNGKKIIKFSGPFQEMADVTKRKNRNGRRYTSELWKKALADESVQERLGARRMLGELDHPLDEGQIRRTSHIITEIKPDYEKGIIYGTIELLNHDQGDAALIRALVEQDVQVCVSSRGFGDYMDDGCTIDPDSFKLQTWDIVLDPSVSIAQLEKVEESVKQKGNISNTLKRLKEDTNKKEELTTTNTQEFIMDEKFLALTEAKGKVEVTLAKTETTLTHMSEKVETQVKQIAQLEKANLELRTELTESTKEGDKAATLIEKIVAEKADLSKKVITLEATLKEYEGIEEKAIKTLESLKAEIKSRKTEGDEAAKVIIDLLKKVKENSEEKPTKSDTEKGAVGHDKAKGEEDGDDDEANDDEPTKPNKEDGEEEEEEEDDEEGEEKGEAEEKDDEEKPKEEDEEKDGEEDDKEKETKSEKRFGKRTSNEAMMKSLSEAVLKGY